MEITKEIHFDEKTAFELEMHSVLNVLSVLSGLIQMIQLENELDDALEVPFDQIFAQAENIHAGSKDLFDISIISSLRTTFIDEIEKLETDHPELLDKPSYIEHKKTILEVLNVLDVRVAEIIARNASPDDWELFPIDSFKDDFHRFFHAMEQNSRGRYRIIHNLAEQEEKDYLVNFEVASDMKDIIAMPLLFKDVVRDLIANARKYTMPGGTILVGLAIKNNRLRFVVEDSGVGIPSNELEKVVDFGFRASNIKDTIRTMGGGFGLTKAYYVTKKLNGRMWIESELLEGTKITIELPVPENVQKNAQ